MSKDADSTQTGKMTVQIFGIDYPLKGVSDAKYMQKLAQMVDEHMRKLAKRNQYLPPDRLAVLTALYMADQYMSLKKDYDDFWGILEENRSSGSREKDNKYNKPQGDD